MVHSPGVGCAFAYWERQLRPQQCQAHQCNALLSDQGHPYVSVSLVRDTPSKHMAAMLGDYKENCSKSLTSFGNIFQEQPQLWSQEGDSKISPVEGRSLSLTGIFFQTLQVWCFCLTFPTDLKSFLKHGRHFIKVLSTRTPITR